jgi:hypothetical protein
LVLITIRIITGDIKIFILIRATIKENEFSVTIIVVEDPITINHDHLLILQIVIRLIEIISDQHLVEIHLTSKIKITSTTILVDQDKTPLLVPIQLLSELIAEVILTLQERTLLQITTIILLQDQWIRIHQIQVVEDRLMVVEDEAIVNILITS